MLISLAQRSPNIAIRVPDRLQIELPEPPLGGYWVRNGFVVWDWVDLHENDWFWLDTISPINPAWSAHIGTKARPVA